MAKKLKNFLLDEELSANIKEVAKLLDTTESYLVNLILETELVKYSKKKSLFENSKSSKK